MFNDVFISQVLFVSKLETVSQGLPFQTVENVLKAVTDDIEK
jgi:hypothetical protein